MTLLGIFIGIVFAIAVLALATPKHFDISRSIVVHRPLEVVFDDLRLLKRQNQWSPWAKRDPQMEERFTGTDGQVGATNHWKGNKEVGEGQQQITKIVEGERIESELRFIKPFKSTSTAYLVTEPVDRESTRVSWGFSGKNGFPMNFVMMLLKKSMARDFEQGLAQMKEQLENS